MISGWAQEMVTIEQGKVTLLEAMLEHTTWPDEDKIDQFNIGLYGRDRALQRALNQEIDKFSIRGKPAVVTLYNRVEAARAAHIWSSRPRRMPGWPRSGISYRGVIP